MLVSLFCRCLPCYRKCSASRGADKRLHDGILARPAPTNPRSRVRVTRLRFLSLHGSLFRFSVVAALARLAQVGRFDPLQRRRYVVVFHRLAIGQCLE